jgi:hypothetical protein
VPWCNAGAGCASLASGRSDVVCVCMRRAVCGLVSRPRWQAAAGRQGRAAAASRQQCVLCCVLICALSAVGLCCFWITWAAKHSIQLCRTQDAVCLSVSNHPSITCQPPTCVCASANLLLSCRLLLVKTAQRHSALLAPCLSPSFSSCHDTSATNLCMLPPLSCNCPAGCCC